MDAYQILVITLSVLLGLLLIIAVVFLVLLIKLLKQVKRITDKADHVIEGVESFSDILRKAAGPIAIGKFFTTFSRAVHERKRKRGR